MSELIIRIETDNAAFDSPNEVARILRQYANHIQDDKIVETPLRDFNGNTVGEVTLNKEDS